mmetsp:Transcript_41273/g.61094  ORF Transcript_41273/g.61094 Transcript_41273/m.61094 type:complete len:376 (-) Transcript_41273:390-1517(-)|eukprot:CAMPEP_0194058560 /NCGR_PEP_ID=MMETSP0009_2-20130614/66610_1 /TAXON_ID=210454 /ORGANISM="Grammatophora oceanica, Strain CCMP 410" /LENGTH=375 /DNA_ID=CAMNT_0038708763 /DNA_START=242 /DNA_END=1369 /DNA_ORIENTATION=+
MKETTNSVSRGRRVSLIALVLVLVAGVVIASVFAFQIRKVKSSTIEQPTPEDEKLVPTATGEQEDDDATGDGESDSTTPTATPSLRPTTMPTASPTSSAPTGSPTGAPTTSPTGAPTGQPTEAPSVISTTSPSSAAVTGQPTTQAAAGTSVPTTAPSGLQPFEGHIFCYGDSLTAGVSDPTSTEVFPYAPFLEEALTGIYPTFKLLGNVVDHMGLPGYTSKQMVGALDHERFGLPGWMDRSPEDIDLLILMIGTNDVLKTDRNATEILETVTALHEVALAHPKVKATMAIDIPPAGFRKDTPSKNGVARQVNVGLRQFASGNPRVFHQYFPFAFVEDGEDWASDRLHFSPEGHERLGNELAPVVRQIVQEVREGE